MKIYHRYKENPKQNSFIPQKGITVLLATKYALWVLNLQYNVKFDVIMTDNSREFTVGKSSCKVKHPYEILLASLENGTYIRPYYLQTN